VNTNGRSRLNVTYVVERVELLMSKDSKQFIKVYDLLLDHFGSQHWWPGDSAFEMVVGAVLTQNTSWHNVKQAIGNLKRARKLSLNAMLKLPQESLAKLIRPTGYFNLKAKRLGEVLRYLKVNGANKNLDSLRKKGTEELRRELLSIKGVGPETADSILLYALGRPVFVVDTYTHRVFSRHSLVSEGADYQEVQTQFRENLPISQKFFNEYHALIVAVGKDYCKPRPRCPACPLVCLFGGRIPPRLKYL